MEITDQILEKITLAAKADSTYWPLDEVLRVFLQILVDGTSWPAGDADCTAVVILPGQQDYRITRVLQGIWPEAGKYLWIAGTRGDPAIERDDIFGRLLAARGNLPNADFIECQGYAANTPEQMKFVCRMLRKYIDVNHLIVATAAYHLPRCVLTLVKEMKDYGSQRTITPQPLRSFSGNSFAKRSNQVFTLELAKILRYQNSGQVASVEEWEEYSSEVLCLGQ
jgi:hypothetical protein